MTIKEKILKPGIPPMIKDILYDRLKQEWDSVRHFCMATKLDNDLTVESVSRMVSPDRPDTKGVTAGNFIIVARKLGFAKKEIKEMLEHIIRERPDTRQKELLSLLL